MVEGPIVARISGSWSRCSLVSDGTERSDTSSGPMAMAPYCGSAFRARSWIGSCGLQKSVIVSASSFPCRREAKICCSNTRVKNSLEPGQQRGGRPGGLTDVRGPQDMVRLGQVQHVHDAQDLREGIRQEIGVDRLPALVRDLIPVSADGLIEALVEQGEPADQGHGGGDQQGDADLLTVPRSDASPAPGPSAGCGRPCDPVRPRSVPGR